MILHVLATFVIVCFIFFEWAESLSSVVFDWFDISRSTLFTLAVGYILYLSWIK